MAQKLQKIYFVATIVVVADTLAAFALRLGDHLGNVKGA